MIPSIASCLRNSAVADEAVAYALGESGPSMQQQSRV